jgi:hypothetical protein
MRPLERLAGIILSGLVGLALAGMPLAMLGFFRPVPLLFLWIAATAAIYRLGFRLLTREKGVPADVAALALVAAIAAFNVAYAGEQLFADRDPGTYATHARWIANEGRIMVDGHPELFSETPGVRVANGGYAERPDGSLEVQFLHLFPAMLGAASWLGGTPLLLAANSILGGVALLFFYLLAARLMRPWLAAGATAALALNFAQVHFSRSPYSEIPVQAFLFGGLWLIGRAWEEKEIGTGFVGGVALGATCMLRIDSLLLVAPLLAFLAYQVWAARAEVDQLLKIKRFALFAALGIAVTLSLGVLDGMIFSPRYLGPHAPYVWFAAVAVAGSAVALVAVSLVRRGKHSSSLSLPVRYRLMIGSLAALVIVAGMAFAYFVRPHLGPLRDQAHMTAVWLGWYLGPVGLAAGVLGWAAAARGAIYDGRSRWTVFVFMFSVMTLAYLFRPGVSPDHVWAMRRFTPVTIPGLVLFAFAFAGSLLKARQATQLWRAAGFAVIAAALLAPAIYLAPLATAREYGGLLKAITGTCQSLPKNAVVIVENRNDLSQALVPLVWTECRLPGALLVGDAGPTLEGLKKRAGLLGRPLYLLALTNGEPDQSKVAGAKTVAVAEVSKIASTFLSRPQTELRISLEFSLVRL